MADISDKKKLVAVSQHYIAGEIKYIGDEYDAEPELAAELVGIGRAAYADKLTEEQKDTVVVAKEARKGIKSSKKE